MSKLPNLPSMKSSAPAPVVAPEPDQAPEPASKPTPEPTVDVASQYLAQKSFAMKGKSYLGGDPIDISDLADHKISQLLNQRWIRPNPDYKPT